ncbi:MAG TPA: SPOR domain-containing protein [Gammaproteobacteria bacterium]
MTMDILLKERLVGAVVLVLAAVIFIPVVLDGPDSTTKVTQSVALPELGSDDDRQTVRIDLDPEAEVHPVVSNEEPVSIDLVEAETETGVESASPAPVEAASEPVAKAPVPVEPAEQSESGGIQPWTVQVGSFSNDSNAETLAAELRDLGFPAYVSRFDDGSVVHHRVRVGGFASRDAAQTEADEIRAKTGQPARPARNL